MFTGSILIPGHADKKSSAIAICKEYEDLALMVEGYLRRQFARQDLWALPYSQITRESINSPCLRIIDGSHPDAGDASKAVQVAKNLCPQIYGDEDVYISDEEITVDPDGDGLKFVIEHLLSLRYGHDYYAVEFESVDDQGHVIIEVNDLQEELRDVYDVPNEVIVFVMEKAREFRPDLDFTVISDTRPQDKPALFAPGFRPV